MTHRLVTALSALSLSLVACSVDTTPITPPGPPAAGEETPAPGEETPPAAKAPTPGPVVTAPKLTPDPAFTAIADAANDLYAAAPAEGDKTYVTFRKAGGAIGWGSGTLVRRYLATGALDTSFATGGTLTTTLVANPNGLAIDTSGRVLVGGTGLYDPDTTSDTGREIVVLRVAGGAIDTTYGSQGRAVLSFSPANTFTTNLVARADGGVFVSVFGRTSGNESYGSFLVDAKGAPVAGYGPGGFRSAEGPTDAAFALGDDIILPGAVGLARIGPTGTGKTPLLTTPMAWATRAEDGAVFAVVASKTSAGIELARFEASGKRDTTFAPVPVDDSFRDVALLPDGGLLLADAKGISWAGKTGGALTLVSDTKAERLFVLGGAKKLEVVADKKVLRFTLG